MRTPQAGTLSTSLAIGVAAVEEILHAHTTNTIVLLEWALVIANEADKPMVGVLKGIGINMATFPWETLYVLQDGITTELRARESHALQVLSK